MADPEVSRDGRFFEDNGEGVWGRIPLLSEWGPVVLPQKN